MKSDEIIWNDIEFGDEAQYNNVDIYFRGMLCGHNISMYTGSIHGESFWQSLIRSEYRNMWASKSCDTQEECEAELRKGMLILLFCKMTGLYDSNDRDLKYEQLSKAGLI